MRSDTTFKRSVVPLRCMSTWLLLVLAFWLSNYSTSIWTRLLLYKVFLMEELGAIVLLWILWSAFPRRRVLLRTSSEQSYPLASDLSDVDERDIDEESTDPFCEIFELDITPEPLSVTNCGNRYRARRALRRHLHRKALEELRTVVVALGVADDVRESKVHSLSRSHVTAGGLRHLHKGLGSDNLLAGEVATYRYAPDIAEHVQRLLEDRSAVVESGIGEEWLTPIPE